MNLSFRVWLKKVLGNLKMSDSKPGKLKIVKLSIKLEKKEIKKIIEECGVIMELSKSDVHVDNQIYVKKKIIEIHGSYAWAFYDMF